jgi:hypothetical protein
MADPNRFGTPRYASSKSPGKGNKAGKGRGYNFEDAGGRTKNAGAGGRTMIRKTGVKKSRSTDGRTGGNKASGGKDNPFHTAARLASTV